jgi:hypothetical protein
MHQLSYRYLSPSNKIYIITKKDCKYPLNFGLKRFYTSNLYTKDVNSIIGFKNEDDCNYTFNKLQFQRLTKECINIDNLKSISDILKLQSIVVISKLNSEPIEVFLYKPKIKIN